MPVSVMVLRLFLSHSLGHSKVKQVNFLSVNSASFRPQKGEGGERKKTASPLTSLPPTEECLSPARSTSGGGQMRVRRGFIFSPSAAVMLSFLESPQREREEEGPGGQGPLLPPTHIRQRLNITPLLVLFERADYLRNKLLQ